MIRAAIYLTLTGALAVLGTGCSGDSLLGHHVESNRRDVAEQRWNSVRGDMKLQVAEQHLNAGRLKEAKAALREVLAMRPTEARVYQMAARLYLEEGEIAKADDAVTLARKFSGDRAQTEYLAGIVSQRYGRLDEALTYYREAARLDTKVSEYLMAAGETLVALDRPADALALVEPRLYDFDGDLSLRMLAARVNRILGLRGPAVSACLEAHRFSKDDPATEIEIGLILIWAGQHAEGIEVLKPLVDKAIQRSDPLASSRLNPDGPVTPTVVFALADAYIAVEKPGVAQDLLKPLLANDSHDAIAWMLYARAALANKDADAAALAMTAFHNKNNPTADSLLLQGYIAFVRGEFVQAQQFGEESYGLDSSLHAALWLAGRSALARGDVPQAKAIYQRAVEADPGSSSAKALLAGLSLTDTPSAKLVQEPAPVEPQRISSTNNASELPLDLWIKPAANDGPSSLQHAARTAGEDEP